MPRPAALGSGQRRGAGRFVWHQSDEFGAMTEQNYITRRRGNAETIAATAANDFFLFRTKAQRHEEEREALVRSLPKIFSLFQKKQTTHQATRNIFVPSCLRAKQKNQMVNA